MRNVAFFVSMLIVVCVPFVCGAQVLINEILADPASDWDGDASVGSRNDEWVEIVNVGGTAVDLSHYRLVDASGGFNWRYGFSGMLAATMIGIFLVPAFYYIFQSFREKMSAWRERWAKEKS